MIDVALLQRTWKLVAEHEDFASHFYSRLFLAHPELRPLFGASMASQRAKLAQTLGLVVRGAGDLASVAPRLQSLGRAHRGFGAQPDHYIAVGTALLETLAHFLDDEWTPEVAATWHEAYRTVGQVMVDAAKAEIRETGAPALRDATIADVHHDHGDRVLFLDLAVDHYPAATGHDVALALPGQPGNRTVARVLTATKDHLVVHLDVDPGDPVALRYAALQPGDRIRLGAPLDHVESEGGPDGQPR